MAANKEDLKDKYMEFQMLMQQLQQLQQNITSLEKHVVDLRSLDNNLDVVLNSKTGSETLVPLGSGIFLKGILKETDNVVMNIGANACVEKTIDEAKETINKQLEEVSSVLERMQEEDVRLGVRIQELQTEFQDLKESELE